MSLSWSCEYPIARELMHDLAPGTTRFECSDWVSIHQCAIVVSLDATCAQNVGFCILIFIPLVLDAGVRVVEVCERPRGSTEGPDTCPRVVRKYHDKSSTVISPWPGGLPVRRGDLLYHNAQRRVLVWGEIFDQGILDSGR